MEERPYSSRLKKVGELLDQDVVSREEVVSELGGWTLICTPDDHRAERASGTAGAPAYRTPGSTVNTVPAVLRINIPRNSNWQPVCRLVVMDVSSPGACAPDTMWSP